MSERHISPEEDLSSSSFEQGGEQFEGMTLVERLAFLTEFLKDENVPDNEKVQSLLPVLQKWQRDIIRELDKESYDETLRVRFGAPSSSTNGKSENAPLSDDELRRRFTLES